MRSWQVSPAELEAVLQLHTGIADAAVVGVPAEDGGEVPRAYVVAAPSATLTEAAVQEFLGTRLARYKALAGGVVFVDAVPRGSSGKVLRRVLKERVHRDKTTAMVGVGKEGEAAS